MPRRGLVVGIANEDSIAFGCAAKLRAFGAADTNYVDAGLYIVA